MRSAGCVGTRRSSWKKRSTLIYGFRPGYQGPRAELLAARNLIHVKILNKEEMQDEEGLLGKSFASIKSSRRTEKFLVLSP